MTTELVYLVSSPARPERGDLDWKAFSRALLNVSTNGVFAVSESGTVVISNQMAKQHFGLFPGAAVKTTLPEFWPRILQTLNDRTCQRGIPLQSKTSSFVARISVIIWRGESIGALCVLEDRTELEKIAREMLSYRKLNRELDAIIDCSHDGLWICDEKANVIHINPASERINRITAREVVGRNMKDLVHEGFVDRSVTLEVIKSGRKADVLQTTRDGVKLILTGNPVFDDEGRLLRIVVNERDITEIDILRRHLEEQKAAREGLQNRMLEMQVLELESSRFVACSPAIIKVLHQATKVAQVDSTILIQGESGTGKERIAEIIHRYSARSSRPMIKINCGAIPDSLVESELFGYEKGAFTGAKKEGKPGHLELADKSILFLDEIAELPLAAQVKLLRFLEDGQLTRIGGTARRQLDVRILAATNRNIEAMVEAKTFRRDLYYRLHVIPIHVPPLRDRRECILSLVRHFLDHFKKKLGIDRRLHLTARATDVLLAYDYPGNVRELMNICERLSVMTEGDSIGLDDLPSALVSGETFSCVPLDKQTTLQEILDAVEREVISRALEIHGTQTRAAKALGVNQSTIARKRIKHGLIRPS